MIPPYPLVFSYLPDDEMHGGTSSDFGKRQHRTLFSVKMMSLGLVDVAPIVRREWFLNDSHYSGRYAALNSFPSHHSFPRCSAEILKRFDIVFSGR